MALHLWPAERAAAVMLREPHPQAEQGHACQRHVTVDAKQTMAASGRKP